MAENVISNKFHYFFNHKIPGFIQWISNDIFTACYFLTVKFYVFDAEYGIYEGCPKIPWTGSITFNVFSAILLCKFLHNVSYTILYQNFIFTHETGLKKKCSGARIYSQTGFLYNDNVHVWLSVIIRNTNKMFISSFYVPILKQNKMSKRAFPVWSVMSRISQK